MFTKQDIETIINSDILTVKNFREAVRLINDEITHFHKTDTHNIKVAIRYNSFMDIGDTTIHYVIHSEFRNLDRLKTIYTKKKFDRVQSFLHSFLRALEIYYFYDRFTLNDVMTIAYDMRYKPIWYISKEEFLSIRDVKYDENLRRCEKYGEKPYDYFSVHGCENIIINPVQRD